MGHFIKIWGDRYGLLEETKGSGAGISIDFIIVTSNYEIDTIWSDQIMA